MTSSGQQEIKQLCARNCLAIPSVTGDCFMQRPFWKMGSGEKQDLFNDFVAVVNACGSLDVGIVVVPLVDNGALTSREEEESLLGLMEECEDLLSQQKVKVAFESDYPPEALARFIDEFNPDLFGINYDIGNSASLGFNVEEEFACYGQRITNVHVKDRVLGGNTVPLCEGNADFEAVFRKLSSTTTKVIIFFRQLELCQVSTNLFYRIIQKKPKPG